MFIRTGLHRNSWNLKGFTLIELLVVITIIGALAALLLPGIQNARAAARRTQCLNNVHNIATAMQNFVTRDSNQTFPASGYWNVKPTHNTSTGATYYEDGNFSDMNSGWRWDLWDPCAASTMITRAETPELPVPQGSTEPVGLIHSWVVPLLPYLDRSDLFDAWDFTGSTFPSSTGDFGSKGSYLDNRTRSLPDGGNAKLAKTSIAVLACPDDVTIVPGQGNLSYVVNGGFSLHWFVSNAKWTTLHCIKELPLWKNLGPEETSKNLKRMGLLFLDTTADSTPVRFKRTMASIRDGTSHTVLLSENVNAGVGDGPIAIGSANPYPANTSFFVNGPVSLEGAMGPYDYSKGNEPGEMDTPLHTDWVPGVRPPGTKGSINGSPFGRCESYYPFPNSLHSGGVHIAMCDGSARFSRDNISGAVWARLVTPQGGQIGDPSSGAMVSEQKDGTSGWRQLPIQDDDFETSF